MVEASAIDRLRYESSVALSAQALIAVNALFGCEAKSRVSVVTDETRDDSPISSPIPTQTVSRGEAAVPDRRPLTSGF